MSAIFLSASVPDPNRHPRYYGSGNQIAIGDAVLAVASRVLLNGQTLVSGGHPAITPFMRTTKDRLERLGQQVTGRLRTFQSSHFQPDPVKRTGEFVWTEDVNQLSPTDRASLANLRKDLESDLAAAGAPALLAAALREDSLLHMRQQMLQSEPISAAVFIGGMEGCEHEFYLLRRLLGRKPAVVLLGSTGAAADILLRREWRGLGLAPTDFQRLSHDDVYDDVVADYLP